MFDSSAADAVTVLNVEPGGCRPVSAFPTAARSAPLCASSTTMPPFRSPSAVAAASWTGTDRVVFDVVRVPAGVARQPAALAVGRTGDQPHAGPPDSVGSSDRSRPAWPYSSSLHPSVRRCARSAVLSGVRTKPVISANGVPAG